ncbi:MAG: tetratricopeptide repeat protein [bacterium]|nr:tetratricopeptide repeat protein [bacterium]
MVSQSPEIERLTDQIKNSVFKMPDSAKIYLLRLLDKSSRLHDTVVAKTYSNLGITYNQLGVLDSSEYYFNKGIDRAYGHALISARLYSNKAITLRTGSRYNESLEALKKSLILYKEAKFLDGEAIVYGEMASNFNYMLQPEKSITYLKKALAIFKKTGNDREVHIVKQKLGNFYYNNGDYEFARDIFEEVLPEFAEEKGLNYYITVMNYAQCLIVLKDYKRAEKAFLESEAGFKRLDNKEYRLLSTSLLGKVYGLTGNTSQAIAKLREAYQGLYELRSPRFTEVAAEYLKVLNQGNDYGTAMEVIDLVKPTCKCHLNSRSNKISLIQISFFRIRT